MTTIVRGKTTAASNEGSFAFHAKTEADPAAVALGDGPAAVCCATCGGEAVVEVDGVSHHLTADGDIDYDTDADHVALDEQLIEPIVRQAPATDWGRVDTRMGSRTPWGEAQHVDYPAPGIAVVTCAGHGGVKLSPERNAAIPAALRNASGWYEEDCAAHIVAMHHPEAFRRSHGGDLDAIRAAGKQGVIDYFPQAYEAATGETIPFGQSQVKDRDTWEAQTAGQAKLFTSGATEHPDYPGMVVVTTRGADGDFTRHMIPVADYRAADSNRRFGAATVEPLLPASAIEVPKVAPVKPTPRPAVTTVDTAGLSASAKARAAADLDKQWRDRDGRIFTLRQDIEAGKYCGKNAYYNDGRWSYSLNMTGDESRAMPVSKAVFDAFTGPDSRSDSQKAWQQVAVKQSALERAQAADFNPRTFDTHRAKLAKAREELANARAEAERIETEHRAVLAPKLEAERAAAAAADKAAMDAAYAQLSGR